MSIIVKISIFHDNFLCLIGLSIRRKRNLLLIVDNPNGSKQVENMILYKILIRKSRIRNFSNNPFLERMKPMARIYITG